MSMPFCLILLPPWSCPLLVSLSPHGPPACFRVTLIPYSLQHFKRSSSDYLYGVSGSKWALKLDDKNSWKWVPCSVSLSSSQWWAKVPIRQSSKGQFRVHSGLYESLQVSFLSWLSSNLCLCNPFSNTHSRVTSLRCLQLQWKVNRSCSL